MGLVEKAKLVAMTAHDAVGQKRKYTGEPYWYHCQRVAESAAELGMQEEAIAAAWLHDVIEDTMLTYDFIVREVSPEVATLVWGLTECQVRDPNNKALSRRERKQLDTQWMAEHGYNVQTLKMLDATDNFQDISKYEPAFCRKFVEEIRGYVKAFKHADASVVNDYKSHVVTAFREVWLKDPFVKQKGVFDKDTETPNVLYRNKWVKFRVFFSGGLMGKMLNVPARLGELSETLDTTNLFNAESVRIGNVFGRVYLNETDPFNPTEVMVTIFELDNSK